MLSKKTKYGIKALVYIAKQEEKIVPIRDIAENENISQKFLNLRVFSSIIWITYGILTMDEYIASAYVITLISSTIVLYVKMTQVKEVEEDEQIMHIKETFI